MPAVVKLEMADGRTGTGTMITPEGLLLTAGHLLVEANQPVKVFLPDGREFHGISQGIDREADVGMVKLVPPQNLPDLELQSLDKYEPPRWFIGATYVPHADPTKEPLTHIVGVHRVMDDVIWTDFDVPEFTAGGPLLDREAHFVGMLLSRSGFGGFQFITGARIRKSYERLKKSEVWGEWQSGSGPMVGIVIRTENEGCHVIEVMPGSPAAAAGLQLNDFLTKVSGQPVNTLAEVYALMRSKNPGDKVQIHYRRGEQEHQAELNLTPRWP